ncbi:MAG TPA: WecB/TagA/CpsF family glycosyltransferase [Tepidisphaeraceae bacterium]|nr:WecB/TagA/CpsF family glycosyltransferase [Tepidisphaeraceae bacterium]
MTQTIPMARPRRHDIFGVRVSATSYAEVIAWCLDRAAQDKGGIIDLMPVHGLISAARDEKYRTVMNAFDVIAPDGQPVRWALNKFHKANLTDRVYGPELTIRLCGAAAEAGVPIYLYGSSPEVIELLKTNLVAKYPKLNIVGAESPPFRPLTPAEDAEVIERINSSGAKLVFLGTGCPKQELFAYNHRHSIHGVQLCVGAAFDFHAGKKKIAPAWMQKRGLEWVYRLCSEPKRLWKRYLVTNSIFVMLAMKEMLRGKKGSTAIMDDEVESLAAE